MCRWQIRDSVAIFPRVFAIFATFFASARARYARARSRIAHREKYRCAETKIAKKMQLCRDESRVAQVRHERGRAPGPGGDARAPRRPHGAEPEGPGPHARRDRVGVPGRVVERV